MSTNFPPFPPLPQMDGKPMTRENIIEALWCCYEDSVEIAKMDDPATVGFPDLKAAIAYIEEFGLPSKPI